MPGFACLVAAAVAAGTLARRLCGDDYAAVAAGLVYTLAPLPRAVVFAGPRLAAGVIGLPLLLLAFYRASAIPDDSHSADTRVRIALGACLAVLGAVDPRCGVAWGLIVWLLLLIGYSMDRRRAPAVWSPAFRRWALACVMGVVLYAPLWWWRLRHRPGWIPLTEEGPSLDLFWSPSQAYVGIAASLLALAAVFLSRSYRGPARLWAALTALMLWLYLGVQPSAWGRTRWWAPSLYRLFLHLPWLGRIETPFYGVAAQLGLAVLAAFGVTALLACLPLRGLRWSRPLAAAALLGALASDYIFR